MAHIETVTMHSPVSALHSDVDAALNMSVLYPCIPMYAFYGQMYSCAFTPVCLPYMPPLRVAEPPHVLLYRCS